MKKLTEEEKKKRKSLIGKIVAFLVIIAISVACSNYNFMKMGHDFVMSILSIATGQSVEEPVNTLPPQLSEDENQTEQPIEEEEIKEDTTQSTNAPLAQ